jgi:hypothetical protein
VNIVSLSESDKNQASDDTSFLHSIRNFRLAIIDAAQEESWNQILEIDQQLRVLLEGGDSKEATASEHEIEELGRVLECYQSVIDDLQERQKDLSRQADELNKAKRSAISYLNCAK